MSNNASELPTGWVSTRLGELYSFEYGKSLTKGSRASAGNYPVYGSSGIVGMHDQFLIEGPAIIVGRKGAAGSVSYSSDNLWPIDTTYYVRDDKNLCLKFSYYLFRSLNLAKLEASTAIPGLNRNHAYDETVLLPPLPEQHRIVAKIEELFSELDKGIENLKTAQAQLKVYRQALLKHALEGKLTAHWRGENSEVKDIWQEKNLGSLISFLTSGSRGWAQYYSNSGDTFIRAQNLKRDFLDLSEKTFVSLPERAEGLRTRIQIGDLLITITGANVTKSALVEHDLGVAYVSQHVALCRPTQEIVPKYLYWFIVAEAAGRKQLADAAYGAGKPGLNLENIRSVVVPLPPYSEQKIIVELIEEKLSVVDQLDQTITASLQQAEALRQSILKKAFSGQLVAQDANDEPASVLLTRIKAEKTAQAVMAKPRKPKKAQAPPAPAQPKVIPFPVRIGNISATDLHAGILARAYRLHAQDPKHLAHFGHVKAEKISHLVEAHLGIGLERMPIKDAAGPNDYPHLKKVESRARKANWFEVRQQQAGGAYVFNEKHGFNALLDKTAHALGERVAEVDSLLKLLLPLNTKQAEIVATLYAAWNNLLLLGCSPQDEDIVYEARENWHVAKLNIDREKFFKGLEWMRKHGLVPAGKGRYVSGKGKRD